LKVKNCVSITSFFCFFGLNIEKKSACFLVIDFLAESCTNFCAGFGTGTDVLDLGTGFGFGAALAAFFGAGFAAGFATGFGVKNEKACAFLAGAFFGAGAGE